MKKTYLIFFSFLILIIIGISCKTKSESVNFKETITININDEPIKKTSDIFEKITYLPLETNDNVLIGNIGLIKKNNNTYLVYDESSELLFLYDSKGKYINKIDNKGKGPGEFIEISDFDIIKNKVVLLVNRHKLIKYNLNGEFLNESRIPFFCDHFIFNNENLWILSEGNDKKKYVFLLNSSFKVLKDFFPHNNLCDKINFWPMHPIFMYKNDIFCYIPKDYALYRIHNNNKYGEIKFHFKDIMPNNRDYNNSNKKINSTKIPVIRGVYFVSTYIITQFTYNNELYQHIYSLKTKESKLFKGLKIEDDLTGMKMMICYFYGTNNDYLYGTYPAIIFNKMLLNSNNSALIKKYKNIVKEYDNDLLTLFKIKKF